MCLIKSHSQKAQATEERFSPKTGVIIVAHGDRGNGKHNASLLSHTRKIRARCPTLSVSAGVLNGEPSLESAWSDLHASGVEHVLIYPLFMSNGFFVKNTLPRRLAAAQPPLPSYTIAEPLGLDEGLIPILVENLVRTARSAGMVPRKARLIVVGHGSKFGQASADATNRVVSALEAEAMFGSVAARFLEEAPFFQDEIKAYTRPTIVCGFFSGSGLHAQEDVPNAIANSSCPAIYAGAIGCHTRVPDLIVQSLVQLQRRGF